MNNLENKPQRKVESYEYCESCGQEIVVDHNDVTSEHECNDCDFNLAIMEKIMYEAKEQEEQMLHNGDLFPSLDLNDSN